MKPALEDLIKKQKERLFSTAEISVIRNALKHYGNEHIHDKSELELATIKIVWEKVKKIHQKQKDEDKAFEELW